MTDSTAIATVAERRSATAVFSPDVWSTALDMAKALADSTIVPKDYRGRQANCLVALEMAARLEIPVLQVMQNMYLVHGRPAWSAQFLIACVNSSRRFSPLRYSLTGNGDERTCVAHAVRMDGRERVEGPPVSIGMARREGWFRKSKTGEDASKWHTMPELMLRYRAAAFFARVYCPDIVMGMYAADEVRSAHDVRQVAAVGVAATAEPHARLGSVGGPDLDAYARDVADIWAALQSCPADEIEALYNRGRQIAEHHGVTRTERLDDLYTAARREAKLDDGD